MAKFYTVYDLMTEDPDTVGIEAPLREVLVRMKEDGCRQLPVLAQDGNLAGIITDRDVRLAMNSPLVLRERWQDENLLATVTAGSCMTADPVTVSSSAPAYRAAEIISTHKFGALPVVDDGTLVGIITVTDILNRFIDDQQEAMATTA
jgi:acetoin utilization protein AcuB